MNIAITTHYCVEPFGPVSLCAAREGERAALAALIFGHGDDCREMIASRWSESMNVACSTADRELNDVLDHAHDALNSYFASGEIDATLPLAPRGTDFDRDVWSLLCQIERGATRTYGDIARSIGKPGAAQAVGGACGRNPIAIFIPCHRVLDARGSLHGYAGGLARKAALLEREGVMIESAGLFARAV